MSDNILSYAPKGNAVFIYGIYIISSKITSKILRVMKILNRKMFEIIYHITTKHLVQHCGIFFILHTIEFRENMTTKLFLF